MDAVLQRREIAAAEQIRLDRDGVDKILGKRQLGLAEIVEDVMMDQRLLAGVADAEPDAVKGRPDMRLDRSQAVVPGMAAAGLGADLAQGKIELVMKNDDLLRRDLEEAGSLADGATGIVHIGLRLERQH